ncbi:MAG: hypothetical protein GXO43_03250, partial [Crenarchaeota archaeon]|nr:hypothetical protein [Thermoproteota archaeon]
MKRYFKLVKLLDRGKITIREFMERIEGKKQIDVITAAALYRIYIEDGGRKYGLDDFLRAA